MDRKNDAKVTCGLCDLCKGCGICLVVWELPTDDVQGVDIGERIEVIGRMGQQVGFKPGVLLEGIYSSKENKIGCVGRHAGGTWCDFPTPASQIVGVDDGPREEVLLATDGPTPRNE